MKRYLLSSAAIAVLMTTGIAVAQNPSAQRPESGMSDQGAGEHGGTASKSQSQMSPSGGSGAAEHRRGQSEDRATQRSGARNEGQSMQSSGSQGSEQQKSSAQKSESSSSSAQSGQQSGGSAAQNQKSSTERNAQGQPGTSNSPSSAQSTQPGQNNAQTNRAGQTNTQSGSSSGGTPSAGSASTSASGNVTLDAQQKTEIRQTVLSSAPRVDRVDFNVAVGTAVPRTVHVVEVPQTLVRIHPEWRGHKYFVTGDRIIIVDANTLQIVAIVDLG